MKYWLLPWVKHAGYLLSYYYFSLYLISTDTHHPCKKKWKILTPGSIIATCLVIICSLAFSWYVSKFGTYNKLYGSIGTIIVLLALMFLNSLILLIGFEINASIYALAKTREDKEALKDQVIN
ncbi:YihY/virulence factor BrkB family protein [Niabella sp. W65]|nr:YihY/virulence factor BrkB family protein [Niabella sp. W65]MCH7366520.1 YihY/virulence factor BrkB family protein [Niabella sp. W65]